MTYKTQRLTDFSQVGKLYKSRLESDFAEDELKPLSVMKNLGRKAIMTAKDCSMGKRSMDMRSSSGMGRTVCWTILP